MLRKLIAVVATLTICATVASPAKADTGFGPGFGLGFGSAMGVFTPMDASSLMGQDLFSGAAAIFSPSANIATLDALSSFEIVTSLAQDSTALAQDAEIARNANEAAQQERLKQSVSQYSAACPSSVPSGTLRMGAERIGAMELCSRSVAAAPSQQAAAAIAWAFTKLGAPYACGGVGRMGEFQFDCSSLVSRAYYEGAGMKAAGGTWAPTTREMVPWGGSSLAPWLTPVEISQALPGDLFTYDTGGATYRHVVMMLADGYMLHTNSCGDVAHVTTAWGTGNGFLGARRATV